MCKKILLYLFIIFSLVSSFNTIVNASDTTNRIIFGSVNEAYKEQIYFKNILNSIYYPIGNITIFTYEIGENEKVIDHTYHIAENKWRKITFYNLLTEKTTEGTLNMNKIFKCYDDTKIVLPSAINIEKEHNPVEYNSLSSYTTCINLYETIAEKQTTLHEELLKLDHLYTNPKAGDILFGSFLASRGKEKNIPIVLGKSSYNSFQLNLWLAVVTSYFGEDRTLESIFSDPIVQSEIKKSGLDLQKTKGIMLSKFGMFLGYSYGLGILLYDDEHEFFMPLYDCSYRQDYNGSQYILPGEEASIELLPYKLYDIPNLLAPFIAKEYRLQVELAKREMEFYEEHPDLRILPPYIP